MRGRVCACLEQPENISNKKEINMKGLQPFSLFLVFFVTVLQLHPLCTVAEGIDRGIKMAHTDTQDIYNANRKQERRNDIVHTQ